MFGILFTHSVTTDWYAITSKLPTANILTTPETLFYSDIHQGAAALISCFPSGIQAKRKVKNVEEAQKWNTILRIQSFDEAQF